MTFKGCGDNLPLKGPVCFQNLQNLEKMIIGTLPEVGLAEDSPEGEVEINEGYLPVGHNGPETLFTV